MLHSPDRLIRKVVRTGVASFPEITFALRLPPKPQEKVRVFAYSYHYTEPGNVLANARDDNSHWNRFGAQRNLAVLTWNVGQLWITGHSFDEINRWKSQSDRRIFGSVARAWLTGFQQLASEFGLHADQVCIYGASRGANFSTRLVLSRPEIFSVALIHNGGSFEEPNPRATGTFWLISNGELDPGKTNALRFYRQTLNRGIPILMKTFAGVGHIETEESLRFAVSFLDFCRKRQEMSSSFHKKIAGQMKSPPYAGDLFNNLVFPLDQIESIPEDQRIPIPDAELARMWGRVIE